MILVTGANGFVGTALCERLRRDGRPLRAATRSGAGGTYPVGDLAPTTDWTAALDGVTEVIHLAARVHVMHDTSADPLAEFRHINVAASVNLAEQAARAGVRRFVFLSSIKVNGEATLPGRPFLATDAPAAQDPYGQSKHEAELALREVMNRTSIEVAVIRPPLVYGPGVKANFRTLMRLVHRGLPLPLGRVDNRRSLIAVDNLVDLLLTVADHRAAVGGTFLASDGYDMSTAELITLIARAMGKAPALWPVPPSWLWLGARLTGRTAFARRLLGSLQVDVGLTRQQLGWTPPIQISDAVARTVAAYLQNPQRPSG